MHLLYCDETNLQERSGDFFVYAGVIIEAARARDLSHQIDTIRADAKVPPDYRLKFNPGPTSFDNQQFIELKKSVISAAVEAKVGLLVSTILHDIATNPDHARLNAINTLCYHFDCLLSRFSSPGLVLVDRFDPKQADGHLAEKFSVGVVGLPFSPQRRLSNIVGFHYAAIGQSHFCSLIDVVLGSLRFAINAFTRGDAANMPAAKRILEGLEPLFFRQRDPRYSGLPWFPALFKNNEVTELSFFFSPKTVRSRAYREKYIGLKAFLAESGIDTAQPIEGL